jgi:hypothetical protein
MKKISPRLNSEWIVLVALLIGIAITASVGSYHAWIHGADHRDFYPRWAGARMVLEGADDLYSVEATQQIQIRLYGKTLPPDRDQQGFAYPAYSLPFLIPFALIPDIEIAAALWVGIAFALLILSFYLLMRKTGSKIELLPLVLLIFWSYTLLMLFQGQMTGLVIASLAIGYWAFRRGFDWLSGGSLVIGLIKPQLVFIPILLMLFYALREKRWHVWLSALLTFLVLLAISFVLVGWWVGDWAEALIRYNEYAQTTWTLSFLWRFSPLFCVGLLLGIGITFWQFIPNRPLAFAAALPMQLMLFPQTLIWGLSILSISLLFAWFHNGKFGVIAIWLFGWVAFFTLSKPGLWEWQTLLLPASTYALLQYLSMLPLGNLADIEIDEHAGE